MTPIVSAAPAPEVSTRLGEFDARRRRFYTLFVTFLVLSVLALLLVAVVYPTDGIEARLPEWLSAVMALLLPGLPTLVLEFAEKYPWTVLTVGVAIWLIRRASHVVKDAAQEYAFQAWRRSPVAGSGQVQDVMPPRRGLLWAPPRRATLGLAAVLGLLVVVNTLSPQPAIVRADVARSSCVGAQGDCRLAPGQSVVVTARAGEPRNETGVLLEAGEGYTARSSVSLGGATRTSNRNRRASSSIATSWAFASSGGWNGGGPIRKAGGSRWSAGSIATPTSFRFSTRMTLRRRSRSPRHTTASWCCWSTTCRMTTTPA